MKAFTLIELIIYIAIVSMVLILICGFAGNIIYGNAKNAVLREVQQNARFAMERIIQTIRSGQNPTTSFTVTDYTLYQETVPLTTSQVKVTNLQFSLISNTYKINLSIEYKNPSGRSEYTAQVNLESAAAPRQ